MKTCIFFGHRHLNENIQKELSLEIENLINSGVTNYYVGNNGAFDRLVYYILTQFQKDYEINVTVVLAYLDCKEKYTNSIFPSEIETVPKRFAIDYRNKWMVKNCDIVICYIRQSFGGAYKFVSYAKKHNKRIIEI